MSGSEDDAAAAKTNLPAPATATTATAPAQGMTAAERRLLRRLKERDEAAFQEMVVEHQHRVFNLVFRMLGNREEAEDVAQEVFVTVFKSIDSFRGDSKFSTWLYRIAANQCKNRLKYLGRRSYKAQSAIDGDNEHLLDGAPPSTLRPHIDGPDAVFEGRELEKLVQDGIATLDDDQRQVLLLRDVEDLSYDEIREVTGVADGTVKSRLHRARTALKEYLAKLTR
jgi:RNA polymerase sigma-70 factor, ECF subfamily